MASQIFRNTVVLINGATGGIGTALAKKLAKERCKLALIARNKDQLELLVKQIKDIGGECSSFLCDVTKTSEIQHTITSVKKNYNRIDIAIITAGILVPNPIETFDSTIIQKSVNINFMGAVYFIEYLLPIMKQQHSGTIAVVSTLPDKRGVPGWGAYGSSKAALSWLLDSLRAEAKQKYNIDIVTIKPGSVQTSMIKEYPRHNAITPEDAAYAIIQGLKKKKKVIQFPFDQTLVIRLLDLFPVSVYDSLPIDLQKGEGYPSTHEEK